MLIGYAGALESEYWLMLLFPVLSAAIYLSMIGTLVVSIAGVGAYFRFSSIWISERSSSCRRRGTYWPFAA